MSELMNVQGQMAGVRWKLLSTASATALLCYVTLGQLAHAQDADKPQVWIELGGQGELAQGLASPFVAPFMSAVSPTPDVYKGDTFADSQRAPRFVLGLDGKVTLQPTHSDWIFSAGVRYGRSHLNRNTHHQTQGLPAVYYTYPSHAVSQSFPLSTVAFRDVTVDYKEHHMVLDFGVGRDVGIGFLGRDGSANVNVGVRVVEFGVNSTTKIYARPMVGEVYLPPKYIGPKAVFHAYTMIAHAERSFNGVGPSLSWNASTALIGNTQDGELMLDWGVNAALIFGRQKAKTDHTTKANHEYETAYGYNVAYGVLYASRSRDNPQRSRRLTVPNLGGNIGLSVKYPNFKFSVGYRGDFFFGATDVGIDARKDASLGFNGPYASVSIGLGG